MRRRTQLYLDESQYRWLKRKAGHKGSIAGVVRQLIDSAANKLPPAEDDPAIQYLLSPPARAKKRTSVTTLDQDIYGH